MRLPDDFLNDLAAWEQETGYQLDDDDINAIWQHTAENGQTDEAAWEAFSQIAGLNDEEPDDGGIPEPDELPALPTPYAEQVAQHDAETRLQAQVGMGYEAVKAKLGRPLLKSEQDMLGALVGAAPLFDQPPDLVGLAEHAGWKHPGDMNDRERESYMVERLNDLQAPTEQREILDPESDDPRVALADKDELAMRMLAGEQFEWTEGDE